MSTEGWKYHIDGSMVKECHSLEDEICSQGGTNGKQNHYFIHEAALMVLAARNNEGVYPVPESTYAKLPFSEVLALANETSENAQALYEEILLRSEFSKLLGSELCAYENASAKSTKTLKEIRSILNIMKDATARLVEAYTQSDYFQPAYENIDFEIVGDAQVTTSFDPNTREWLEARYDTIGGSDVSNLVVNDFEDPTFFTRKQLEKTVQSKIAPVTDKEISFANYSIEANKRGPLYRGTVWESLSREIFARKFPKYKVYNTKNQYKNCDRSYQQVNFDGLLSDRPDGKINGILELKTGTYLEAWKNGVPLSYRAQVLYYLNSTGLDYAIVAVLINDGELVVRRLAAHDAVAPGVYEGDMSKYISERVEPWFEEIKALRA